MEEEILQMDKFEDIYFLINHFCQERLDTKTLMEKFAEKISMHEFERLRREKREEIMETLKRQLHAT